MRRPKMVNLRVEETSGVDHPAHLVEGWVVMKSADSSQVEDVLDALTHPRAEEDPMPDVEKAEAEVTVESLTEALAKAQEEIASLRAQIADAPEVAEEEDLMKSAPEPLRKMLESLTADREEALAKAAEAEATLTAEREAAADAAAIEKARGWSNLSVDAEKIGPALRHLGEVDADLAKAIEETLESANAQAESAALFAELGKSAAPAGGDAIDKMNALAKAAVEAGTAQTFEQAFADVAVANPDLYAQHLSEKGA